MKPPPLFLSAALIFSLTKLIPAEELMVSDPLKNFKDTEQWHLAESVELDT